MLNSITTLARSVLLVTAVLSGALSCAAQAVIPTQRIVEAMLSAGIAARPDQIEILSQVNSVTASATMRVLSVSKGAAGAMKVKLRCQDNHECLPFYVLVHGLDEEKLSSRKLVLLPAAKVTSPQNIIRSGDHAILTLESPDSRMSFPVICLQNGVRGQRVRAVSTDRKQFFDAEVVAPGMLKGSL